MYVFKIVINLLLYVFLNLNSDIVDFYYLGPIIVTAILMLNLKVKLKNINNEF